MSLKLEEIEVGHYVRGVARSGPVRIVDLQGASGSLRVIYEHPDGRVGSRMLMRDDEPDLSVEEAEGGRLFDGEGGDFRLVSEAMRIDLAYLFDPYLAVNTSGVEPLPHQISAVYDEMLGRQTLRFCWPMTPEPARP